MRWIAFILTYVFFFAFIWYIVNCGNCQVQDKRLGNYNSDITPVKCLNPKNWVKDMVSQEDAVPTMLQISDEVKRAEKDYLK